MKAIENKKTTIIGVMGSIDNPEDPQQKFLSYSDILKIIMDKPPTQGYSISEMRQRLKIYSAIVLDGTNSINFEDTDFLVVKTCVNDFKWAAAHKDIVDFVDLINTL